LRYDGAGDVFGLFGVLESKPQYATVATMKNTTMYSIELNDLIESTGGEWEPPAAVPAVLAKHLRSLADRVVES
jgi:CRP-like cAMP-binding protein